jgi:peptidoglycan/xylan/chitin deacetylase (PgdA/CDA1 family)
VLGAAALAGVAAWAAPAPAPHLPPLCGLLGLERRLPGAAPGVVALTFDDGPHPEGTPAILDALAREGARATFFLVGEQVQRHRALAGELVAAGHEVAVHGHRHRSLLRLGPGALRADLDRCGALVGEVAGRAPALHRAPYGAYSAAALAEVRRRGWRPVLWSRWGRDWSAAARPAAIAARAAGAARAGDVILLHDADHYAAPGSWRRTADALPRILELLARRGLRPVPLGAASHGPLSAMVLTGAAMPLDPHRPTSPPGPHDPASPPGAARPGGRS